MIKTVVFVLVLLTIGSSARAEYSHVAEIPQPYRRMIRGMLSGQLDPWLVKPYRWANRGRAAKASLDFLYARLKTAPGSDLPDFPERFCLPYPLMSTKLLLDQRQYDSSPITPDHLNQLSHERVHQQIAAKRNAERLIELSGKFDGRAASRQKRRELFNWPAHDSASSDMATKEANFLIDALIVEQCRIDGSNIHWLSRQLIQHRLIFGVHVKRQTVRAAFALLRNFAEERDIAAKWLPFFKRFARRGVIDRDQYARLVDNLKIGKNRPQVYGSVFRCVGSGDGIKMEFTGPAIDLAKVSAERAVLGLQTLDVAEKPLLEQCRHQFPFSM